MENASYISLSRQMALWRQMDGVANNIANANTPSFKSEHMMFSEYMVKTKGNTTFGDKVSFVQDVSTYRNMSPGALTNTGNPLDVGINDEGFFVIDTPEGPRYSRNGHFRLDEGGQLVTTEGLPVMSANDRPFFFAPNETQISIAKDGTVSTENGQLGKLRIVNFSNPQELRKVNNGLYATDQSPEDIARPSVVQGMIEESNVKPIIEMTRMIDISRTYMAVQKMIDNEHERLRKAVDTFGGQR